MDFLIKIFHNALWVIGMPIFKFFFGFEVSGQENLKGLTGPLIIAANHNSWIDGFLLPGILPFNSIIAPIRFAIGYKYYRAFFPFSWIIGGFSVKRGIGLENTLKKALGILEKKGAIGIFPEGKRRRFGRKKRGRRGAPFLALKTNSFILPILIEGNMGLNVFDCVLRKRKIKVKIGRPFRLPLQKIEKRSDLNRPAQIIMDKIYELK